MRLFWRYCSAFGGCALDLMARIVCPWPRIIVPLSERKKQLLTRSLVAC